MIDGCECPGDQAVDESHISSLVEILKSKRRTTSLDEAVRELAGYIEIELLRAAKERLESEAERIRILRDPPAIEAAGISTWYAGPGKDDCYWPPVFRAFTARWKDSKALEDLDRASTRVVADLGNPHSSRFSGRGLVVGDVQSGKTSNFTVTIAKAADAGYRFFIVMSGTKNKLRKQTQGRLDSDLVGPNQEAWLSLTDVQRDFGDGMPMSANQVFTQYSRQRVLVVIKKNSTRLDYLLNWLRGANGDVLLRTPTLIIDDEADEASINAAKAKNERSKVNGLIVDIVQELPRVSFVGYTATPYANFFIDASSPKDLYPRDFIINLPSSNDYFGYERIFGRERTRFDETDADIDGFNMIRSVPEAEAKLLRPTKGQTNFNLDLRKSGSLVNAVDWFLMASAARLVRGQASQHSSMLIHTSQRTNIHKMFREPIENLLRSRAKAVASNDSDIRKRFEVQWIAESAKVASSDFRLEPVKFIDVWKQLGQVFQRIKVVIENSMSAEEERLIYGQQPGTFVVVGGDVLSRGLTLEGLAVSYFTRSATTYDTLMQMGRWFGYRPGYGDLPRIWMTDDLKSNFYVLGGIDREMRQLIEKSYSGHITPENFAPMIRLQPNLAVTSRMKMGHADLKETRLSYGDSRAQTILFAMDETWLKGNLEATSKLVSGCLEDGGGFGAGSLERRRVLKGVDASRVLAFLESYKFHENSWNLDSVALCKYIRTEREAGSLDFWNLVVVEGEGDGEEVTIGRERFGGVIRSRLNIPGVPYANIKSLMSEDDALADMDLDLGRPEGIEAIREARNEQLPKLGLLVIYPIDRQSQPKAARNKEGELVRVPLDAPLPTIGVGLVFPRSVSPDAQKGVYIQQRIAGEEVEEPEEAVEEDAIGVIP
jgi:hypothetical protein